MSQQFQLPFVRKERLAKDTWSFFFDKSGLQYNFLPGQYNNMTLITREKKADTRSFTLAASPLEETFFITTKIGESAFKKTLSHLTPGTLVTFQGPMGGFYLREKDIRPRVFLSGGIGITPFRSMMHYVARKKLPIPITLIASFSSVADILFYKELTGISLIHPHLRAIFTISDKKNIIETWRGEVGRISQSLIKKYVRDITVPLYAIVGSEKMTESIRKTLLKMEIPNEKIAVESFTGY